jgi:hypothetical protein
MDFHTAAKMGQQTPEFAALSMLTPLQTYTPHIVDECYSYSSSPESAASAFPANTEKNSFMHPGLLTPRTPEPFSYPEPIAMSESFDQYMGPDVWTQEGQIPIGLGFENDIPGLMPMDPDMNIWAPTFNAHDTPMEPTPVNSALTYNPPTSSSAWTNLALSVTPNQSPHTRAVPSLSISEYSAPDSDSPNVGQGEWAYYQNFSGNIPSAEPVTSTPYLDSIRTMPMDTKAWDECVFMRMFLTDSDLYWP